MSLESAIQARNSLLYTVGKNALNMKYPKEFEIYIIALELTDEAFKPQRYFIFPVNPSSIEEMKPQLTNVKKTLGGITVLKNPTFVPTEITLSGTFGRSFKVLLGNSYEELLSSFTVDTPDKFKFGQSKANKYTVANGITQFFDERYKTGYGCTKILEDIVEESKQKNRRLIFHNPALGNNYLVTAGNLRLSMNEQSNMIWNYSLNLKSVAPLESIYTKDSPESVARKLNTTAYIQQRTNALIQTTKNLLATGIDRVL